MTGHVVGKSIVLNWIKRKKVVHLQERLDQTDSKLALMNAQMAAEMVRLAGQTDDLAPLKQAEEALNASRKFYTYEDTPVEVAMVQTALGDMLLKLGRAKSDKEAIARAKVAYRTSITLASMHGDDEARQELRDKIKIVDSVLGQRPEVPSLFRVA